MATRKGPASLREQLDSMREHLHESIAIFVKAHELECEWDSFRAKIFQTVSSETAVEQRKRKKMKRMPWSPFLFDDYRRKERKELLKKSDRAIRQYRKSYSPLIDQPSLKTRDKLIEARNTLSDLYESDPIKTEQAMRKRYEQRAKLLEMIQALKDDAAEMKRRLPSVLRFNMRRRKQAGDK